MVVHDYRFQEAAESTADMLASCSFTAFLISLPVILDFPCRKVEHREHPYDLVFKEVVAEALFYLSVFVWWCLDYDNDCRVFGPLNAAFLLTSMCYYNMVPHYLRCTVRDPFAKFWKRRYDLAIFIMVVFALALCYLADLDKDNVLHLWVDHEDGPQHESWGPFDGYSRLMFCWLTHRPPSLFYDQEWHDQDQCVVLEVVVLYGPMFCGFVHSLWAFFLAHKSLQQGFAFSGGSRLRMLSFMRRYVTGHSMFWVCATGVTAVAYWEPQDDCLNHSCIKVMALLFVLRATMHLLLWFSHVPYELKLPRPIAQFFSWFDRKREDVWLGMDGVDSTSIYYKELREDVLALEKYLAQQRKRDQELLDRANEWYLRAEVVKLTSHGISMTILAKEPSIFEREIKLLWPEHHQLQLHGAKPSISLFTFQSMHAESLSTLRAAFYTRQFGTPDSMSPRTVRNRLKSAGSAIIAAQRLSHAGVAQKRYGDLCGTPI